MDLTKLKTDSAAAGTAARELVMDLHHGRSQFAAAIRSNLDAANELIAHHEAWLVENPLPAPKPAAAPATDGTLATAPAN